MPIYAAHVIDKATGSDFVLCVRARDEAACTGVLSGLGFAVGPINLAPELRPDPEYRASLDALEALGDLGIGGAPDGRVRDASGSCHNDIGRLIEALEFESSPVDRHFLLQQIVRLAYTVGNPVGKSKVKAASKLPPEAAWALVEPIAWQWIVESAELLRAVNEDAVAGIGVGGSVWNDLRKHLKARGFPERAAEVERLESDAYHRDYDDSED